MAVDETEVELRVIRPLKVIAFICACIAVLMLVLSILTKFWLEAEGFRQGLWEHCFVSVDKDICSSNLDKVWIMICGALCLVALMLALVAAVLSMVGILSKDRSKKHAFYLSAICIMFLAIVTLLAALVIFPVIFIHKIEEYRMAYKLTHWFFSWSYGLSWGAWIFMVGAAVLLLIDREADEISYKEKARCYINGL